MQPKLKIIKTVWQNNLMQTSFIIVDLSVAGGYPQNFLCTFPKNLFKRGQRGNLKRSRFFQIFGEEACGMAEKLLEDALGRETDLEVKTEIKAILKEIKVQQRT